MGKGLISVKVLNFVLVIVILNGIVLAQLFYDSWRMAYGKKPNVSANILIEPHPLPANIMKKSSLGLNNFMSDITWIETIQYYGGGMPYEKYRKLAQLMTLTTDMDPRFLYPYDFGLTVLPGEGFVKEAIILGDKGLKSPYFKDSWEIPYGLAMIERTNVKDNLKAAKYFQIASKRPGVPEMAGVMAGLNYEKADQRLVAYGLYKGIYDKTKNQYVKDSAKKHMDHLALVFNLEKAAEVYKGKFGKYPPTLEDLVKAKIVENIPTDPTGQALVIDPNTGKIIGQQ